MGETDEEEKAPSDLARRTITNADFCPRDPLQQDSQYLLHRH